MNADSEVWGDGVAQLADRLCASPEADPPCFANPPRACLFEPYSSRVPARDRSCSWESAGEQRNYFDCKGGTSPRVWTHPITVFLNHPCDLATDLDTCRRALPNVFDPSLP